MAIVRQDEILEKAISGDPSAVPRYNLRAPDGTLIGENIALELANAVTQMGTPVNAAALNEMLAASGITSGSSTAYTLAQEGFSLFDGAAVRFRLHVASGVKPTLNVNGTGAKALVDAFGDAMQAEAAAGSWIEATYSEKNDSYVVGIMKYQEFPRRPDIVDIIDTADGAYQIDVPISTEYKKYSINLIDANSASKDTTQQLVWSLLLTGISARYVYLSETVVNYDANVTSKNNRRNTSSGTTTNFSLLAAELTSETWHAPAEINIEIAFVNGNCYIKTIMDIDYNSSLSRRRFEKTILLYEPTIGNIKLTWQRPSNQVASYHNKHMMIIKGEK